MAQQIRFGALCVVCAALARFVKRGMQNRDTARQERKSNNNTPAYSRRSGPGLLYALFGALWASVRRFSARECRDTARHKNCFTGPQMAFTAVLRFGLSPALLDADAK